MVAWSAAELVEVKKANVLLRQELQQMGCNPGWEFADPELTGDLLADLRGVLAVNEGLRVLAAGGRSDPDLLRRCIVPRTQKEPAPGGDQACRVSLLVQAQRILNLLKHNRGTVQRPPNSSDSVQSLRHTLSVLEGELLEAHRAGAISAAQLASLGLESAPAAASELGR